jgi:ribonuclease P protein component
VLFRLPGKYFSHQKKKSTPCRCSLFTLLISTLPSCCNGPAFGTIVTKKIGSAVVRNRIKRRLRSAAESLGKQALFKKELCYIIAPKPICLYSSHDHIKQSLKLCVCKIEDAVFQYNNY